MFQNYFKIALRSILRQKAYSLINISGLAIGMASSILILLWVRHELSYDRFHKHAEQVYRINSAAGDFKTAVSPSALSEAAQSLLPAIKNTVRLAGPNNSLFANGDRKFEESRVFYADSTFLQVFSYPLIKGDAHTALQRPDGILITAEMATKYFGHEDPMGKILRMNNNSNKVVTGDAPHIGFRFLHIVNNQPFLIDILYNIFSLLNFTEHAVSYLEQVRT